MAHPSKAQILFLLTSRRLWDTQKNPDFHNVRAIRANRLKPAIRYLQPLEARFTEKGFSSGTLKRFARSRRLEAIHPQTCTSPESAIFGGIVLSGVFWRPLRGNKEHLKRTQHTQKRKFLEQSIFCVFRCGAFSGAFCSPLNTLYSRLVSRLFRLASSWNNVHAWPWFMKWEWGGPRHARADLSYTTFRKRE